MKQKTIAKNIKLLTKALKTASKRTDTSVLIQTLETKLTSFVKELKTA